MPFNFASLLSFARGMSASAPAEDAPPAPEDSPTPAPVPGTSSEQQRNSIAPNSITPITNTRATSASTAALLPPPPPPRAPTLSTSSKAAPATRQELVAQLVDAVVKHTCPYFRQRMRRATTLIKTYGGWRQLVREINDEFEDEYDDLMLMAASPDGRHARLRNVVVQFREIERLLWHIERGEPYTLGQLTALVQSFS